MHENHSPHYLWKVATLVPGTIKLLHGKKRIIPMGIKRVAGIFSISNSCALRAARKQKRKKTQIV
jgi:hypothetical protein